MKLKNVLMIAAMTLLTASAAQAQRKWNFHYDQDNKDLFASQELTLDLAGAYGVGRAKFNDTFDRSLRHGDFGASVGVNYFITRNLGIGADVFGLDNGGDFVDAASGSLILRLPLQTAHLAPYIFGGGGRTFDGPDSWTAHAGVGLEMRLNPHTGIFIDGRHIFAGKSNISDAALIRAGIRLAF